MRKLLDSIRIWRLYRWLSTRLFLLHWYVVLRSAIDIYISLWSHVMFMCSWTWWRHQLLVVSHDDVIKWKHFPRYWPFARGIHRSPVNSPHKGQWCRALIFSLICVWINEWVNNHEAGDLRRYRAHYDVIVMKYSILYMWYKMFWFAYLRPSYRNKIQLLVKMPMDCSSPQLPISHHQLPLISITCGDHFSNRTSQDYVYKKGSYKGI